MAAPGGFSLTYLLRGTGQYTGVAGSGTSSVLLQGDPNSPPTPFVETGFLRFRAPEPATAGLLMLALGGVARASSARPRGVRALGRSDRALRPALKLGWRHRVRRRATRSR